MPENGQDQPTKTPARQIVLTATPAGINIGLSPGMTADDAEVFLLKAVAVIQRGLLVGQINGLLDHRKVQQTIPTNLGQIRRG